MVADKAADVDPVAGADKAAVVDPVGPVAQVVAVRVAVVVLAEIAADDGHVVKKKIQVSSSAL